VGTVGLLLGFSRGNGAGWTSPVTIGMLVSSVALLVFFVWHELHIHIPLLNFTVFRHLGFTFGFMQNSVAAIATCLAPIYMSLFSAADFVTFSLFLHSFGSLLHAARFALH